MPNYKSFTVTEAERKHVRRRAPFQKRELSSIFFSTRQGAEGISRLYDKNVGGNVSSYSTVENWVAQFKRGDFSTCDMPRPERPKIRTTPRLLIKFTS